jgi:AcrR family transcriptional regulator
VKRRLLDAARELFIEVGFDAASTKKIGARAGVNAAMISYYFGSKEGLSKAVLADAVAPMMAALEGIEASPQRDTTIADLIRGYRRAITIHPWLPRLIVREVLPDNGRLRKVFVAHFAKRAAKMLGAIVAREKKLRHLRDGLDTELLLISLVSLAIFPFVAAPIVEPAMGVKVMDPSFIERLNAHTIDLLNHGVARRGKA